MQVRVIEAGSPQLFNAVIFPEAAIETQQWIYDQFNRDTGMLTDMGRQFMQRATDVYKQLNDPSITKMARRVVRGMNGLLSPNTIVDIRTIEDCQNAKPIMQRYLMANPSIRKLYHNQQCDGYSDSYVDLEPGKIGEDHYDYRRVMHGVVTYGTDADGNTDPNWVAKMYAEDLEPGDRALDMEEQFAVLVAWDVLEMAIALKRDATDVFNGDLAF